MDTRYPSRIVCMTEETTEALYLMGEEDRIVGISGYTVRPARARREKPKISAFITAKFDKIEALRPDLVLGFSDLQADIAAELVRRGMNVMIFNQRGVAEILKMILTLGGLVGAGSRAEQLVDEMEASIAAVRASAARFPRRPRVFFEEWNDPLISGIRWVSELIEIAGGEEIFPSLRDCQAAKDRILDPARVIDAAPEVVIGSWCGKKVNKASIAARPGWAVVPAVRDGHLYEVKSTYILQPGPAALTEGLRQLHAVLAHVAGVEVDPALAPAEAVDPAIRRRG